MSQIVEVVNAIKAAFPAIWVSTLEERKTIQDITDEISKFGKTVWTWDVVNGFVPISHSNVGIEFPKGDNNTLDDALALLLNKAETYVQAIKNSQHEASQAITSLENSVFIFLDADFLLKEPQVHLVRMLKEAADRLPRIPVSMVFMAPTTALEPAIDKLFYVIDAPLPGKEEIRKVLTTASEAATLAAKEANDARKKRGEEPRQFFELKEDTAEKMIIQAQGLTLDAAQNAFSLASVECFGFNHAAIDVVGRMKNQAVKKSGLLEIMEPKGIEWLGGLENYLEWLDQALATYGNDAVDFGLGYSKGVFLTGPPGCLAGDTEIIINRGKHNGGKKITIKEAYHRFNHISRKGSEKGLALGKGKGNANNHYWGQFWDNSIKTNTLSLKYGEIVGHHRIKEILYSGVKTTYVLTTTNGRAIRVTAEHPFRVPNGTIGADKDGFKKLSELRIGDKVLVRNTKIKGKRDPNDHSRKVVYSIPFHPFGLQHLIAGKNYKRISYAKAVVEAEMNNMGVAEFIEIIRHNKEKAATLKFLDPKLIIHHENGNKGDDSRGNLELISEKIDHNEAHRRQAIKNLRFMTTAEEEVVSIVEYGKEDTYDIIMEMPFHNYVANGFVVHNTGKTLLAKITAAKMGSSLLRFDPSKAMGSLYGQTERLVMEILKIAEAVAPAVLLIDEFEKIASGSQSSGLTDGGTTARWISILLTWMQEKTCPIFVLATCNEPERIDPALMRKGRFDEIFIVDLPEPQERVQIFRVHVENRKRKFTLKDYQMLAGPMTEGFSGAEIEAAVEQALRIAFCDRIATGNTKRDLTVGDVKAVIADTRPLSETRKKEIDNMRGEWCQKSKAKFANKKSKVEPFVRLESGRKVDLGDGPKVQFS